MFAKIKYYPTINSSLYYNEKKVEHGKAICLAGENFIKDLEHLTLGDKLARFEQRMSLNDKAGQQAMHITIGFMDGDKLSNGEMGKVVQRYMGEIGFGEQPYLVYRHRDTMHAHVHIVSTNIEESGNRIEMRDLIFWRSRAIVRDLTSEFGLRPFEPVNILDKEQFEVLRAQRVEYGKVFTQRAISDVLNTVVPHYRYGSLEELNAVLREYNVVANRGREDSRLYQKRGLLYHVLDEDGRRVGAPIKASRFFLHPTLDDLERRFTLHESQREEQRKRLETAIEWTFAGTAPTWEGFRNEMEMGGVSVVVQKSGKGREDIFFVDHQEKGVFSGLSLGIQYGLHALRGRCSEEPALDELTERQRIHLLI